jgi:hypothetical protein
MVEALAELFELSDADLFTPSGSQRTPTLLELGQIIFGEWFMALRCM